MATLTQADYEELRNAMYRLGEGKEELKAAGLPGTADAWKAAFQAIETDIVTAAPTIKAHVDAALGVTTSPALFRKLFRVWLRWRDKQGG